MDKLKQYAVFTVLGCLLVLAAGWFLLVSPKRSDAAQLRTDAAKVVSENSQLSTQLQVLKAQAKNLPKQQAKLAAVAAKIPDNTAMPALIRALTGAASSAGIELVSVTPGAPAAPAAAPAAAGAAGVGTLTPIPVSLNVVGGYFQVEQFVADLESLPRSMRISTLSLAPGANPVKVATGTSVDDGRSLATTITAQVFMATNRAPAKPVVVPGQPVAGPGVVPAVPVTQAKK